MLTVNADIDLQSIPFNMKCQAIYCAYLLQCGKYDNFVAEFGISSLMVARISVLLSDGSPSVRNRMTLSVAKK